MEYEDISEYSHQPVTKEDLEDQGDENVYDIVDAGVTATALYDYQGEGDDEISFDPDDVITNIEMIDEGWWQGQFNGKIGLFPANYVRLLK